VHIKRISYALILLFFVAWSAQAKPAARWVELHKDADWNKFPDSEIQRFVGRLQYLEGSADVGFVQRYNPYKLKLKVPGEAKGALPQVMDVYGRSPELKSFRGHNVEIRGKRVQMEVEGQWFDEIWPVEIRALD